MKEIDCAQFFSIVSDYYDGELSDNERSQFTNHFEDCGACMKFFEGFRDTMKVVDGPCKERYQKIQIPENVQQKIMQFILERQK